MSVHVTVVLGVKARPYDGCENCIDSTDFQ